jgi:PAS domain S-box-containing protein
MENNLRKHGIQRVYRFPSVEGVTVYGIDITERKKLQNQLEDYAKNLEKLVKERTRKVLESEQSYRELYESFGEAFIATNWELTVIHWNKAAETVTTTPAKEALGKKIYEVLPEMAAMDITPYFEQLRRKKPARFMMNTVSRQTRHPAIFEISLYPATLGIIIIVEDKTVEEETKRLSAIGQTAGMVGHDIRNPLQSIVSSMFLIKNDLNSLPQSIEKSDAEWELESIQEQISYVDKIISDLQDYARPLQPELVEVNLKQLITGSLSTLHVPDNVEARAYFKENLPKLRTDPTMLRRVLLNLTTNAVQAMPKGGKLTVRTSQDPKKGRIIIKVKDTGVGIPKAMQEKMFKPLITTKAKGQGLGLAVVKRLIDALNGSITFESQEGKGTEFTIQLPLEAKNPKKQTLTAKQV